MHCPACNSELETITVDGVDLDLCRNGCGGIWFDQYEFRKFDEFHEYAGDYLAKLASGSKTTHLEHTGRRDCPHCEGQKMLQHFYSPQQDIEIDECPRCGGIWLDYGELTRIRAKFETDEERSAYARDHLRLEFGGELNAFFRESREKTEKLNRFANMFKYLYPSWYLPGDQDWGKF